jgi:hypothetical protein
MEQHSICSTADFGVPKFQTFLLGWEETNLTSATSVKAISIVPSGGDKTDVCRENTDVKMGWFPSTATCYQFLSHFVQLLKSELRQTSHKQFATKEVFVSEF